MGLFKCNSCEVLDKLNESLTVQLRDLQDSVARERAEWVKERQALIDRLLAVDKPQAVQVLNPPPRVPFRQGHGQLWSFPVRRRPVPPGNNLTAMATENITPTDTNE